MVNDKVRHIVWTCFLLCMSTATNNVVAQTLSADTAAISSTETFVNERLSMAGVAMDSGNWDRASDIYKEILSVDQHNLTALFFLAYAEHRTGRYAFARQRYQQILELAPLHYQTRLCLTLLCEEQNRLTEAYDNANIFVGMFPDSIEVYTTRAHIEIVLDMFSPAEADLSKAIEKDATDGESLLLRSKCRLLLGKYTEAGDDLATLYELGYREEEMEELLKYCNKRKKVKRTMLFPPLKSSDIR